MFIYLLLIGLEFLDRFTGSYEISPFQDEHTGTLLPHKIVFIVGNMLAVAMALYKLHGMSLLPNHASDWLDFQQPPQRKQFALISDSFIL